MLRPRATASSQGIDQLVLTERPDLLSHGWALLIVASHGIRQPSIGVAEHIAVRTFAEVGHVLVHVWGTQGTVQPNCKWLGVAHTVPECLIRLPTQSTTYKTSHRLKYFLNKEQ